MLCAFQWRRLYPIPLCRQSAAIQPLQVACWSALDTSSRTISLHPGTIRLGRRFVVFLTVFQTVLIAVHGFLFLTWVYFWAPRHANAPDTFDFAPLDHWRLLLALGIASISFLVTSLVGFRLTNVALRVIYRVAAVWLGFLNYAFFSSILCWLVYLAARLTGAATDRRDFALAFLALAIAVTAYGVINASWTRVKRITVKLPGLPATWRGRTAVLITDVHLGNFRTFGFSRRIPRMAAAEKPDVVFIGGDLYDGTPADLVLLAAPLRSLKPPLGTFFVEGNHEEFTDHAKYLQAVAGAGVRVLNNERVELDGLQILGVTYRDATHGEHFRKTLRNTGFDRSRASILLTHAPDRIQVSAQEGISLQLSGHTHRGQFWPWTLAAKRMYGQYVYGLQRLGEMQIYTSCGAGTWGPPLRVGSTPEIIAILFE
jgi:predicted MPP superfamily phosphohydrolase